MVCMFLFIYGDADVKCVNRPNDRPVPVENVYDSLDRKEDGLG